MPFLTLDKFTSSTKRINKYYQHVTPDKFDLSPPKKVKEFGVTPILESGFVTE